jgi:hypothetical protein
MCQGQSCLDWDMIKLTPEQQNGRNDTDGESDTGVNDKVGHLSGENVWSAPELEPHRAKMEGLTHVSN